MAIITTTGPILLTNAPVAILGDELAAIDAMAGGRFWRVMPSMVRGEGTDEFAFQPRLGDDPLNPLGSASTGPTYGTAEGIDYLAFNDTDDVLITPPGIEALPADPFTMTANVFQGPTARGAIVGNSAYMTEVSDEDNDNWQGLSVGSFGNDDDLTGFTSGQGHRVSAPDVNSYRDNQWHTITLAYTGALDGGRLDLRVDGVEIATGNAKNAPQLSPGFRRFMVGGAMTTAGSPMTPLLGRFNAVSLVPDYLPGDVARLDTVEGYMREQVGQTV